MPAMRDVFWNEIYLRAESDRDIVILSADFAAPSLDKFRLNLPAQFINLGIAEQNMILLASGMALEGKKVFCYAISPFLTMRCFEQIRLYLAGMNLSVTLVGVGAGVSYSDSGYTHHSLEDIALMRVLPHMKIFQPSDNATIKVMVDLAMEADYPIYFRLDRYGKDNLIGDTANVATGLSIVRPIQKTTILTSGNMMMTALEIADKSDIPIGIVDSCILPFDKSRFKNIFENVETLITLEEHNLNCGLGTHVLETVSDLNLNVKVKRFGLNLDDGYPHEYGGRNLIHKLYALDSDSIVKCINQ